MEITKEIKLKVALQYYGCQFLVCYNIENNPVIEQFTGKNIEEGMYEPDFENKRELLILRPLSDITDRDAIEVAKMLWGNKMPNPIETVKHQLFTYSVLDVPVRCYQLLQSKGYDLPNYLLGGKTLKEAGIAIYEDEVKLFANELKNRK